MCPSRCLIISLLTLMYLYKKGFGSYKVISYKQYKSIDKDHFLPNRRVSSLVLYPSNDVGHLVNLINKTLGDLVYEHAPFRSKEMPRRRRFLVCSI